MMIEVKIYLDRQKVNKIKISFELIFSIASLQKFSSLFFRLLLECIVSWAEDYPLDHKNRNTRFIALYDKLKKSGVKFPDKKYFFP